MATVPGTAVRQIANLPPAERAHSLFALVAQLREILGSIEDAEGEVTPEQSAAIDSIADSIALRAEVYCALCRELVTEAAACDAMAQPYLSRAQGKRKHAELLKDRMHAALELAGMERALGPTGGAVLQLAPAHVELSVTDALVPDEYCEHKRTVSKKRIGEALKAGLALPFAKLARTRYLRWR